MNTVNQCVALSGNAPNLIEDAELMASNKKGSSDEIKVLKARYERQLIQLDNALRAKITESSSLHAVIGAESLMTVQSSVLKALQQVELKENIKPKVAS